MRQRLDERHNLRMPLDLKARLLHSTVDTGRSMNAEILARLERSFSPDPAALIVEALAPLPEMTLEDRLKAGQLIADLGAIILKGRSLSE